MNPRALAAVLAVAAAMIAVALVAQVDGFALSPAVRFGLTIGQAGIAAALAVLPPVKRARIPHG